MISPDDDDKTYFIRGIIRVDILSDLEMRNYGMILDARHYQYVTDSFRGIGDDMISTHELDKTLNQLLNEYFGGGEYIEVTDDMRAGELWLEFKYRDPKSGKDFYVAARDIFSRCWPIYEGAKNYLLISQEHDDESRPAFAVIAIPTDHGFYDPVLFPLEPLPKIEAENEGLTKLAPQATTVAKAEPKPKPKRKASA